MLAAEERHAAAQETLLDRMRFRPQQWQGTRTNWRGYDHAGGERWLGFEGVQR